MLKITPGQSRHVILGPNKFHYLEWPNEGAPVVLLIPGVGGLGGVARQYEPLATVLQSRFRVLAMEQRGHGYSDHTPSYAWQDFLSDIDQFIEIVAGSPVHLIGHSAGASWAYLYAALHPDRVRRMVDIDMGFPPAAWLEASRARETAPAPWASVDEATGQLERNLAVHPSLHTWFPGLMQDAVERTADDRVRWRQDTTIWRDILQLLTPSHEETVRLLRNVQAPSLVLWGVNSPFMTREEAQAISSAISSSELVAVPDSNHVIHLSNPAVLHELVNDFLD